MQNWIFLNRTIFDIETAYLCSTELFEIELYWLLTVCEQKQSLYSTESFEIKMFLTIKLCTHVKLNYLK